MSWIFYALLAPAVYAVINFTDKYIIERELRDYSSVPIFSAIAGLTIGTLFWLFTGHQTLATRDGLLVMASGVLSVWSLVVYLKALADEETSKIIIFFQVTPIITLALSSIFLHEPISFKQYLGFGIILAVSMAISVTKDLRRFHFSRAFWYIMLWDLMLAVAIILVKFVIEANSFAKILSYESWGVALGGLILFLLSRKIRKSFFKNMKTLSLRTILVLFFNELLFITSKALTFFSFTLGPAVLVNVLEGTQVFYGILYGWILTLIAPKVFREDVSRDGITKKIIFAIVLFLGIWLVY